MRQMSRLFLAVFICLVVYPAQAQSVTATVTVGVSPFAIAVNPVSNKIYVAGSGSNNVTVINGADNSTTTVGVAPLAILRQVRMQLVNTIAYLRWAEIWAQFLQLG